MMRGPGYAGVRLMGGMSRDPSIKNHELPKGIVRRVLAYGAPFKGMITVFLITVVAGAALGTAPALLFKLIIDDGVLGGDVPLIVTLSLVVAGMAVLAAALGVVERWCSARIGEGLILHLRKELFDHVQRMSVAFFSRSNTGKLVSRLQSDVAGAQQAFTSTLSSAVSNVSTLVFVVGLMLALSWQLTLAALVLLPLFMIPARAVGTRLAGLTRNRMQQNAEMTSTMTERFSVSGALLVQLFGNHDTESERFAGQAGDVAESGVKIAMTQRVFMTAMMLVASLATAMFYGFGGVAAAREQLTLGTLTALVALLARLYGPLMQVSNLRVDVMTALVSFDRVFEVLDIPHAIADREDARDIDGPVTVSFRDVWFTYPDAESVSLPSLEPEAAARESAGQPVLRGISFDASPGQTVALVGASGGGKTTITNMIARLYDVNAGVVQVAGTDVRDLRLQNLRENVGYVTQDAHLFHDTIAANLRYARPDAADAELWEVLEQALVADLVRRLPDGLDTVVGERGYRLSGGERQRFAIARLLLKAPPLIVLDEATAHLDSGSEHVVQKALDVARQGRTAVVIAHRLSTVRDADQILVVDGGVIVERGTHDELLATGGRYASLYSRQFAQ